MSIQSRSNARLYSCMIFINAERTAGQDSVLRHASGFEAKSNMATEST